MGAIGVLTITLLVVAVVLFAIGYFTDDEDLLNAAKIMLNVGTIIVLGAWLLTIMRNLYLVYKIASVAPKLGAALASGLAKSSRAIGVIGLVIAVVVAWGFFLYSVI